MNSRQLLLVTVVVAVVVAVPAAGAAFAETQTTAETSPSAPLGSVAEVEDDEQTTLGPNPGPVPEDLATFEETSALSPDQTTPDALSGIVRVEDEHADNTTIELTKDTSSNYTLDVEVTGDAENVTFYVQKDAIEASQNLSEVVAYLDGEELDYYVDEDAGPRDSPWVLFEVDHFSTRTVDFASEETDESGPFDVSDLSAPANASQDEGITVEATVTNTGNDPGQATVEYQFNDTVRESTSVSLDAGNSSDVEFNFTADGVEPGAYAHGVYTDSDNETAEIDIEEGEDEEDEEEDGDDGDDGDDGEDPAEPGPNPGSPPSDLSSFQDTSPLDENQTTPDSLAGKLRVEDKHLENTSVELVSNTSTEYTLNITVTGDAKNVTFFLQQQAVESSQNISDVVAYLDGEEMDFYVDEDAGPGNSPWTLFEVDHFSTRTVSFTSQSTELPAVTGSNPPRDLDGDGLYQDIDGDGEFGIFDIQALFGNLDSDAIQNNPTAFDFDNSGDDSVDIFDVQALFDELRSSN